MACLAHWWVVQAPSSPRVATLRSPLSSWRRVSSTAVRTGPVVAVETWSRASQAASISARRSA